jgi:hypothetical protein
MAQSQETGNQTPPAFHTCESAADIYLQQPLLDMLDDKNLQPGTPKDALVDQWLHQSILSARNSFNIL